MGGLVDVNLLLKAKMLADVQESLCERDVEEFIQRVSVQRVDVEDRTFGVDDRYSPTACDSPTSRRPKTLARAFSDRERSQEPEERNSRPRRNCDEIEVVHRPLAFRATGVAFDPNDNYRLRLADEGWYARILERYADAGYGPRTDSLGGADAVARVFRAMPPDLVDALKEGLYALQVLGAAHAAARHRMSNLVAPDSGGTSSSSSFVASLEDDMWEGNSECGYLRFEWDPVTERRRQRPHARVYSNRIVRFSLRSHPRKRMAAHQRGAAWRRLLFAARRIPFAAR